MSKQRESHRQALRQLLDRHSIDEILRLNDRFTYNPSLDEALNSGDGTCKP